LQGRRKRLLTLDYLQGRRNRRKEEGDFRRVRHRHRHR
jgi:hypothetical protein